MRNLQKETEVAILAWIRSHGGNRLSDWKSDVLLSY